MSRRYVLSAHAQHDRDGIFDYTAERSGDLDVAFRVDARIEETFEQIAANPKIGHTRADLGIPEDLRVRRVYSYLVIYDPATSPVKSSASGMGPRRSPRFQSLEHRSRDRRALRIRVPFTPFARSRMTHVSFSLLPCMIQASAPKNGKRVLADGGSPEKALQ